MFMGIIKAIPQMSPSVWREWIEILNLIQIIYIFHCLPPCGGSGLKYQCGLTIHESDWVSLRVEGVD